MVSLLKKYARQYDAVFVDKPTEADVIFTNDVFPQVALALKVPRVKRMDGIFWQLDLMQRNEPYVQACLQADYVVFISSYSRMIYAELFPQPKRHVIIRSCPDPGVFNLGERPNRHVPEKPVAVVACATSWNRPEKRFVAIEALAQLNPGVYFMLVGALRDRSLYPCQAKNVEFTGVLEPDALADVLHEAGAFVNLSYRDPGPKVVAEAEKSGLPIFYADSGGTSEMVGPGTGVRDEQRALFEPEVPTLDYGLMQQEWLKFNDQYSYLAKRALRADPIADSRLCLEHYFKILKEATNAVG